MLSSLLFHYTAGNASVISFAAIAACFNFAGISEPSIIVLLYDGIASDSGVTFDVSKAYACRYGIACCGL